MLTERDLREIEENPWESFKIYAKRFDARRDEIREAVSNARERYLLAHPDEKIDEIVEKFGSCYARVYYWTKSRDEKKQPKKPNKNRPYTEETAYLIRRWVEQGDGIEEIMDILNRSKKNVLDAFDPKWDKQVMRCKRRATNYDPGEKISIAMRESKMIKKELGT